MPRQWLVSVVALLALCAGGAEASGVRGTLVDPQGLPLRDGTYAVHVSVLDRSSGLEVVSRTMSVAQIGGAFELDLPEVDIGDGSYEVRLTLAETLSAGGNPAAKGSGLLSGPKAPGPYDNLYVLRAGDQIVWNGNWWFRITSSDATPLQGTTSNTSGKAVCGTVTAPTGMTYGGYFQTSSDAGRGVYGNAIATSGLTYGGYFQTSSTSGRGVLGYSWAKSGSTYGGYFKCASTSGIGVYGQATAQDGAAYGGYFESFSTSGRAVLGKASATSGTTYGVYGSVASPGGYGLYTPNRLFAGGQIVSGLADGTAPLAVTSKTLVPNLNADLLDGFHAAAFSPSGHAHFGQSWTGTAAVGLQVTNQGSQGTLGFGPASIGGTTYNFGLHTPNDLFVGGRTVSSVISMYDTGNNLRLMMGPALTVLGYSLNALVVKDAVGNLLGVLGQDPESQQGFLMVCDSTGNQASMEPQEFNLNDSAGNNLVSLGIDGPGESGLHFQDANGVDRAHLSVSNGGGAQLLLSDANGVDRAHLSVSNGGGAQLSLSDANGNSVVGANGAGQSGGQLGVSDPATGANGILAPDNISLDAPSGIHLAQLQVYNNAGSISLHDATGNNQFYAGGENGDCSMTGSCHIGGDLSVNGTCGGLVLYNPGTGTFGSVGPDRMRLETPSRFSLAELGVYNNAGFISLENDFGILLFMAGGPGGNCSIAGDLTVDGTIYGKLATSAPVVSAQAHPKDSAKQIVYVCLEGGEAGTYTRGTAELHGGEARIRLPEHFALVTSEGGLTVQLTPVGQCLQLYVVEKSPREILVREASGKNGTFDYLVNGVRLGHENHQAIQETR